MSQSKQENKRETAPKNGANGDGESQVSEETRSTNLDDSPMMAHLHDALKKGTDVGHYGRLTFAMVARHFMDEDELVALLAKQPDEDETKARALLMQVQERDYNPPKRERVLEWQAQQDFQICPTPDDPRSCNVYSDLQFPDNIYQNIDEYYEEQAATQE